MLVSHEDLRPTQGQYSQSATVRFETVMYLYDHLFFYSRGLRRSRKRRDLICALLVIPGESVMMSLYD